MKVIISAKYNSFVHSKAMLWCHKHLFLTVANDLVKDVNFITIFSRRKQVHINLLFLKRIKFPQLCSIYMVSVPQQPQVFTHLVKNMTGFKEVNFITVNFITLPWIKAYAISSRRVIL